MSSKKYEITNHQSISNLTITEISNVELSKYQKIVNVELSNPLNQSSFKNEISKESRIPIPRCLPKGITKYEKQSSYSS